MEIPEIAEIKNKRRTHNAQMGDHERLPLKIFVGGNKEKFFLCRYL